MDDRKKLFDDINDILAQWDPLCLDHPIVDVEYTTYVPLIIGEIERGESVIDTLEYILITKLELEYDRLNPEHKGEVMEVAERILTTYMDRNI